MGGTGETSGKSHKWDAYFHLMELNFEYEERQNIESEKRDK